VRGGGEERRREERGGEERRREERGGERREERERGERERRREERGKRRREERGEKGGRERERRERRGIETYPAFSISFACDAALSGRDSISGWAFLSIGRRWLNQHCTTGALGTEVTLERAARYVREKRKRKRTTNLLFLLCLLPVVFVLLFFVPHFSKPL
jgi:hypothetical protein